VQGSGGSKTSVASGGSGGCRCRLTPNRLRRVAVDICNMSNALHATSFDNVSVMLVAVHPTPNDHTAPV
jgi:hypothetical protein